MIEAKSHNYFRSGQYRYTLAGILDTSSLHLEILPFVLDALHELLEPGLAADVFEEGIVFRKKRIIDKSVINRMFKSLKGLFFFINQGKITGHVLWPLWIMPKEFLCILSQCL